MAQEVPAKNHKMYFVLIAAICNFTVKILTILIFASECKCDICYLEKIVCINLLSIMMMFLFKRLYKFE